MYRRIRNTDPHPTPNEPSDTLIVKAPASADSAPDTLILPRRRSTFIPPPLHFSRIESFGRFLSRCEEADREGFFDEDGVFDETVVDEQPTLPLDGYDLADEGRLAPGTRSGPYIIRERIGRGAFGTVYRADWTEAGCSVAIKVLTRACSRSKPLVARFLAEASAAQRVDHPNVVQVFGSGTLADGRPYHVMELLSGTALDTYLSGRGAVSLEEALPILQGVGRAIDAVHRAGVAHRDLKPSNIFLAKNPDGSVTPKLLDFGVAKSPDFDFDESEVGTLIGTPEYMAPELVGHEPVDHRADIYAFGILTYRMLVGRVPFTGSNPVDIICQHVSDRAMPVSLSQPRLQLGCDEVVAWMLDKKPANRPDRLAPILDAFEALVDGAVN